MRRSITRLVKPQSQSLWYLKNLRLGWAKFVLGDKFTALEAELAKTREKMEAMETTIRELATMLKLHLDKQQS